MKAFFVQVVLTIDLNKKMATRWFKMRNKGGLRKDLRKEKPGARFFSIFWKWAANSTSLQKINNKKMDFYITRFVSGIQSQKFSISDKPAWNVIIGDNGVGKTWILEDIVPILKNVILLKPNNIYWLKFDGKILKERGNINQCYFEVKSNYQKNVKFYKLFFRFFSQKGLLPKGTKLKKEGIECLYIAFESGYKIWVSKNKMESKLDFVFCANGNKNTTSFGIENALYIAMQLFIMISTNYGFKETIKNIISNNGKCTFEFNMLLDEPEIGLSPELQVRLSNWLVKHFPGTRFIVATHSPFMCRPAGKNGQVFYIPPLYSLSKPYEVLDKLKSDLCSKDLNSCYRTGLFGKV